MRVELKLPSDSAARIDRRLADREQAHAVVLSLEGVEYGGNQGSYYEVYVNLPWPWREPPDFHCIYGLRASAPRFGEPRTQAVLGALFGFSLNARPFTAAEFTPRLAQLRAAAASPARSH